MAPRTIAALVLLTVFAAFVAFLALSSGDAAPPLSLASSADCEQCHPGVFAEWKASWHAKAWFDPLVRTPDQSDNFKKRDCIPCHAPRPIFEAGIGPGQRVVERQSNRQDGVDCFSCHKLPSGGFAAANAGSRGPCDPRYDARILSVELCAPCHNQHNTVDEWRAAPAGLKTESCTPCHYPEVTRPGRDGGPDRTGRSHLMRSWRSENLAMQALTVGREIEGEGAERTLRVRVINDKTPHNVPADSRNRALDLVLTFYEAGGRPFPPADGQRAFGQEPGTYRLRFRNPYRSDIGKKNTQIVSGSSAVLEAAVPDGAVRARIRLLYKLTPFTLDEEAIEIHSDEIDL